MVSPTKELPIGSAAPAFSLMGTDGKKYSVESFNDGKLLVIAFMSNQCPYAQAYESRVMSLQRDFANDGVRVCAINSNDEKAQPEDSYQQMQARARTRQINYPYLRDESQRVAQAYRATVTPEFFLFDSQRTLRYHGRFDDNWKEPTQVRRRELIRAVELLLQNKPIDFEMRPASGTPIRWKK